MKARKNAPAAEQVPPVAPNGFKGLYKLMVNNDPDTNAHKAFSAESHRNTGMVFSKDRYSAIVKYRIPVY